MCALGWVNVEPEFQVWVTILGCMSLSLYSRYFGAFSCTDEYEAIIHSLQDFVILRSVKKTLNFPGWDCSLSLSARRGNGSSLWAGRGDRGRRR